jgi:hypothetical protein
VVHLFLIDGLIAALSLLLWYVCFSQYNRRKGDATIRVVESACLGLGKVTEVRWFGSSRLEADVSFTGHWVGDAHVTVRLRPRHVPLNWLLAICRKQKETLTFEANLDFAPAFELEVYRHQWLTQRVDLDGDREWTLSRPGPIILTTRKQWGNDLTPVVNTLMSTPGHNLMSVRFRSDAPHLSATVPLETVSGEESSVALLNVLRELAASASSTSRQ